MRFCLALLLVSTFVGPVFSQKSQPKINSLLWEISGNGTAQPSYLYGTMHVPAKMVYNLSDSFFIALKAVDCVGLETDPSQWQAFFDEISVVNRLFDGQIYVFNSPAHENSYRYAYNQMFRFRLPDNDLLARLLASKPTMVNQLLFRTSGYGQDFEEDTYLDLFIYQSARKLGKPVVSLETLANSYLNAMRSGIPDDKKKKGEPEDDRPSYGGGNVFEQIQDAYRAQDLDLLDSLTKITNGGKNRQKFMLDVRNVEMCARFDSLMKAGKTLFSGVGAAHLPGKTGMLQLFRAMGYSVRPVRFVAHADAKEKQAIDEIHLPVEFKKQFARDSAWSAEAPVPFFLMPKQGRIEESLAADMANGSFYGVYRLPTVGGLFGQSAETMAKRLDSLIYEKIPGKILERKPFEPSAAMKMEGGLGKFQNQPPPFGFETRVSTRTRRGDVQRYKIVATEGEIFLFFVGGNSDYALGKEADQFLKSAQVFPKKTEPLGDDWSWFSPKTGGFRVEMPKNRREDWRLDREKEPTVEAWSAADSTYFLVSRESIFDVDFIEEDTFELNYLSEKIAEQFDGKMVETAFSTAAKMDGPFPEKSFSFHLKSDSTTTIFAKLKIDGPFYYLFLARRKGSEPPLRFFQSIDFQPFSYPDGWAAESDTATKIQVRLPKFEKLKKSSVVDELQAIQKEAMEKSRRLADRAVDFPQPIQKSGLILSKLTDEKIHFEYYETPADEPLETTDSLRRGAEKRFTRVHSMVLKSKNWAQRGPFFEGDLVATDTNSTRAIRAKIVRKGRKHWIFSTVVNDLAEPSAFSKTVFETVEIMDSTAVLTSDSTTKKRRDLGFFEKIYVTDSLERATARRSLIQNQYKKWEPEEFAVLRRAVENPLFSTLKKEERDAVLESFHWLRSPEMEAFFLDFYQKWPDSTAYRRAVLLGLVAQKTKTANSKFLDLLAAEPPFLEQSSKEELFYKLHDSLALAAQLFPRLLKDEAFESYENQIEILLKTCLDSGFVKPKMYAFDRARLLKKLGREVAKLESQKEDERWKKTDDDDDFPRYRNYDYYQNEDSQNAIERLVRLLVPFYKKDEAVRATFAKLLKINDLEIKFELYDLFFQNQIEVPWADLEAMATTEKSKATTFGLLKKYGHEARFAAAFQDSLAMARSYFLHFNDATRWDTLQFVSRHRVAERGKTGVIYFFEIKEKRVKERKLAYIVLPDGFGFPQRVDFTKPTIYEQNIVEKYGDEKKKTTAEQIHDKLASYRFTGRERVGN